MCKPTEKSILLENLRICRCILEYKADENLIDPCRLALKSNIKEYDRFIQKRKDQAEERKEAKKLEAAKRSPRRNKIGVK